MCAHHKTAHLLCGSKDWRRYVLRVVAFENAFAAFGYVFVFLGGCLVSCRRVGCFRFRLCTLALRLTASTFWGLAIPHLTLGRLAEGGGWLDAPEESRRVVWVIAGPPFPNPLYNGALTWSREEYFRVDVSAVCRRVSLSAEFLRATCRPVAARIQFDYLNGRFVLVGGPALDFYRALQARVAGYLAVWVPGSLACVLVFFWNCCREGPSCLIDLCWFHDVDIFFPTRPRGVSLVVPPTTPGSRGPCRTT